MKHLSDLRPYQKECLDIVALKLSTKEPKRYLVSLPMGTGKTVIFTSLLSILKKRALILAHLDSLITQAYDKARIWHPEAQVKILGRDSTPECLTADVLISSIQTARRDIRTEQIKAHDPEIIIVDEAHHAISDSYRNFLANFPTAHILGFSATPYRLDGKGMNNVFDSVIYEKDFAYMIHHDFLASVKCITVKTGIKLDSLLTDALSKNLYAGYNVNTSAYDYGDLIEKLDKEKNLESLLGSVIQTDKRNDLILETYTKECKDRKHTIAFCGQVKHAYTLAKKFTLAGISAKALDATSTDAEKERTLASFREGETKVLFNCSLFTEGFDAPEIDCILMCRPTKSKALYTQCVGRGLRKHPDKTHCLVVEFLDNSRLKLCTAAEMFDRPKRTAEEQPAKEKKENTEKLLNESDGTTHIIEKDLLTITPQVDETKPWHSLPVTQAQMSYIQKKYPKKTFDWDSMNRKQANDLISSQKATGKQLWRLRKEGWTGDSDGLTLWQAQKLIDKYEKEKIHGRLEQIPEQRNYFV